VELEVAEGKEVRILTVKCMWSGFKADFAIVKAWKGDTQKSELQETFNRMSGALRSRCRSGELVEAGTCLDDPNQIHILEYSCNVFSRIKI
jgi:acyl CoA:acetate/3-ketoacid CoA transferase alpha subunit